jgi:hypothetical protein
VRALVLLLALVSAPAGAADLATPAHLASLLPRVPDGWAAEELSAQVVQSPAGTVVEASRSFWHGHGPTATKATDDVPGHAFVDVLIGDRGDTGDAVMPWRIPDPPMDPSDKGFVHDVEIAGQPGYELSEPSHAATEVGVLVRERFLVRLRGSGLTLEDLRGWLDHVKMDELR